jgi:mono/diheme cytochrome c family protein
VRKWTLIGLAVGVGILLVSQVVPYGRAHSNPAVTRTVAWDSPATERLARAACFDCHSNETVWPWYSNVAPISWLVQADVQGGREHLDFSEWDRPQEADPAEIVESARSGSMPPVQYTLLHRGSRLSTSERAALARGLERTLGADPPIGGGG